MSMTRKVAIAYRIYPKVSKVPPVYPDDKLKLSELCLKSLVDSMNKYCDYKFFAMLDNCPKEYEDLFRKYIPEDRLEIIHYPGIGNAGTFREQMRILSEQKFAENVYFAEDDYLYMPDQFNKMLEFIESGKKTDFVTPYDHKDYYQYELHKYKQKQIYYLEKKWKTVSTTCMTFMTNKSTLERSRKVFATYLRNNYDASIWLSLTKLRAFDPKLYYYYLRQFFKTRDTLFLRIFFKMWVFGAKQLLIGPQFKLWAAEPAIATHMESDFLAPNVDWLTQINKIKQEMEK